MSPRLPLIVFSLLPLHANAARLHDADNVHGDGEPLPQQYSKGLDELQDFEEFIAYGLWYTREAAHRHALIEAPLLKECGQKIWDLEKQKHFLLSMGDPIAPANFAQGSVIRVTLQGVDAQDMLKMYNVLYKNLTLHPETAREWTLRTITMDRSPLEDTVAIYKFLLSKGAFKGDYEDEVRFETAEYALKAMTCGVFADTFEAAYNATGDLKKALGEAIPKSVDGLAKRFDVDGTAKTPEEFADFHKDGWIDQWAKAPAVIKHYPYSRPTSVVGFKARWGANFWKDSWNYKDTVAKNLTRIGDDGVKYSLEEFAQKYGLLNWQQKWHEAWHDDCDPW